MVNKRVKRKFPIRAVLLILALCAVVGGYFAFRFYTTFFSRNVTGNETYLYVHTGWAFQDVLNEVTEKGIVEDTKTFRRAAEQMDYPNRVKAGKFRLEPGMNNRTLINRLGGGLQEPVRIRFEHVRLKEDFAGLIASQLEADSTALSLLLNDGTRAGQHGFTAENFFTLFIPNTYEFYWNTSADQFVERMSREYDRFWNEERLEKAKKLGMTPQEVSILASVVKGEALHVSEMPTIAGLYINRLRKGMKLQADPTVIFANQDFSIRRVLYVHLTKDSPYNTYLYAGLPPGPITLPSIAAIDAVLNYQQHNYIYMCAKEDFSGYHSFAVTQAEHNINARRFQRALNERNIKR